MFGKMATSFHYELVSPALLGSMIYQVILDLNEPKQVLLLKIMVVCIFGLDWLYIRLTKEAFKMARKGELDSGHDFAKLEKNKNKVWLLVIDWVSTVLLTAAFWLLHHSKSNGAEIQSLWPLACIWSTILAYFTFHLVSRLDLEFRILGALLVLILGCALMGRFCRLTILTATFTGFTFTILLYVLVIADRMISLPDK